MAFIVVDVDVIKVQGSPTPDASPGKTRRKTVMSLKRMMPTTRLSLLSTSSDGHNQVNVASAELCELCELPICVALLRVVVGHFVRRRH